MEPKAAENTNAFGVETEGIHRIASTKKTHFNFTKKQRYLHLLFFEQGDGIDISLQESWNRCCYFIIEAGKYLRRMLP